MKINEQWLRTWVNPSASIDEIARALTMAGLEVSQCEPLAAPFSHVVVGQIVSMQAHPNADNLWQLSVKVSATREVPIVCSATNMAVSDKVAVAMVGSRLPFLSQPVAARDFNGITSEGFLCSEEELGLSDDNSGVVILDSAAPIGQDCYDYYHLDDVVLEVDLTPNRGDCASALGIAREVAVTQRVDCNPLHVDAIQPEHDEQITVDVRESFVCPRYLTRIIHACNANLSSPLWMQERLRRCGLRPISAIVDITNYVMLELGQPMHAFDLKQINEKIVVRYAQEGEAITLLNGQNIELSDDCLVISDNSRVLALAGVMGCEDSGVTDTTTDIVLESAHFLPSVVRGRARRYNLSTDSSYRFERGVDPTLCELAMARATELLLQICGGDAGPVLEHAAGSFSSHPRQCTLSRESIKKRLGVEIAEDTVMEVLHHLGMQVNAIEDAWEVAIPAHRFDISAEHDLIEELARVVGYDNLFSAGGIRASLNRPKQSEKTLDASRIIQCMVDLGYQEVVTYSFVDPKIQALLHPDTKAKQLLNPISLDLSEMRVSTWSGLLSTLINNLNRQNDRLKIVEVGQCFELKDGKLQQVDKLGALITGSHLPRQWSQTTREMDFYDLKGDFETVLQLTGNAASFHLQPMKHATLHPGRSAQILMGERVVGCIGQLHPGITFALDITSPVLIMECELDALRQANVPSAEEVSKYPSIRRDIAIIVDEGCTWQEISQIVKTSAQELLTTVQLFDVYRGKGISHGKKSMALGLTLQHQSRTLIDEDVNKVIDNVVSALKEQVSATMRE